MPFIIYDKRFINKHYEKGKYDILNFKQLKYYLICSKCFWKASTLPSIKEIKLLKYKKCPICINKVSRFLICDDS